MYRSHRSLLGENAWEGLKALAPRIKRPTRTVLLRQGDAGTHVMLLSLGAVVVTRFSDRGQQHLVAVRHAGDLLGELAVLERGTRTSTVITVQPCHLHVIPSLEFLEFVDRHNLEPVLLRHTLGRLQESEDIRMDMADKPVPTRLASTLIRLVDGVDGANHHIDLTQDELAQLIGASRNAVVNALADLRSQKIVSTSRHRVTIDNLAALRTYAAGSP